MYANILVSTDGSDFAKKGVEQRITLAKALNAKLAVITVTERCHSIMGAATAPPDGIPRSK